jgi:hypothetical protein
MLRRASMDTPRYFYKKYFYFHIMYVFDNNYI